MSGQSLIPQSQINALESDAAAAAVQKAEADHKAQADIAATQAAAAALIANDTSLAAAVVAPLIPAPSLPAAFLAMPEVKKKQTEAIAYYQTLHKSLADAESDLKRFIAICKRSKLTLLGHSNNFALYLNARG